MKFCGQCGAPLGSACRNCGFVNPSGYRFCGMCGRPLVGAPAAVGVLQPPLPLEPVVSLPIPATAADEAQGGLPLLPSPAADLPPALAPLAGERRIATVILADVYRSTDLMEQLGTEAWVEMMNRVLQLLAAEIYRFGGRVDQFRGDGLVAFFGATDAHEDDPERAVLAGLAMQAALGSYADELRGQGIDLKMRVGINTGEVIVASVGEVGHHREDTAMGEGVALAARMETATEPDTVLVSAQTYHLVEPLFEWLPLGEITVKGVSKPIAVYRPLRLRALAESRPTGGRIVPLAFVRDSAVAALSGCVEALKDGRGGIALITGDKGMGKTQLMHEVRQYFEPATASSLNGAVVDKSRPPGPTVTWLHSRCRSYDQSTPYALWVGVLRNWLGAAMAEPEPNFAALLDQQTELLWGDQAAHYRPYLAMLLSLPIEGPVAERLAYLQAEGLRRQLFDTVYAWVEALAARGPLVLMLGDLQFADTSSLDLLRHCLPVCESAAVLWLVSFRSDRTSPVWQFRHYVETEYPHRLTNIDLPPLTPGESQALIEQMVGQGTLGDAATALVIEKAEGNPYYIREIVYALIDQGFVQCDAAGVWRQTRPIQSFNLPGSLRALLLARIDRLAAEERHVLQLAAVIGPLFWRNVLEALTGEAGQLKRCLTGLQRAQLIHEQNMEPELGMAYVFNPSLVRDVVYESLLNTQRTAYHRQVAEQIGQIVNADSSQRYHGLLTYHYHQAGDFKRELYHALGAAAEMQRVYADADALAHYTRVLELLNQLETAEATEDLLHSVREMRFEALDGRYRVQLRMGHVEAARTDARALLLLAEQLVDDPIFTLDALLAQPEVNVPATADERATGLRMVQQALAIAQAAGDRQREAQCLLAMEHLQDSSARQGARS